MNNTSREMTQFISAVWEYYHHYGREFPWRGDCVSPYEVFISEIMLQQTQTNRVLQKFSRFIEKFPDFETLAHAPFALVLSEWTGLGYNRRAQYIQTAAYIICHEHAGCLPCDMVHLLALPGVGKNTVGSLQAFAYNIPAVFIETNIRSVYLHHFFPDCTNVSDIALLPLIEQTVCQKNPREWYYAVMDYGVHIKKLHGNISRRSKHYIQQSKFSGSVRQMRGRVLAVLLECGTCTEQQLAEKCVDMAVRQAQLHEALLQLSNEAFIEKNVGGYSIRQ